MIVNIVLDGQTILFLEIGGRSAYSHPSIQLMCKRYLNPL